MESGFYRLETNIKSRHGGRWSPVAAAAYRSGEKLFDADSGKEYDYTHKGSVIASGMALPKDAPEWMKSREDFWNSLLGVEAKTTRGKDAQICHSLTLSFEKNLVPIVDGKPDPRLLAFILRDFIRENFTRKGFPADWSVHAPDPRDKGSENWHAHILVPLRPVEGNGFAKLKPRKTPTELSHEVKRWRKSFEVLENRMLKRHGINVRVSCEKGGMFRKPFMPSMKIKTRGQCRKIKSYIMEKAKSECVDKKPLLPNVLPAWPSHYKRRTAFVERTPPALLPSKKPQPTPKPVAVQTKHDAQIKLSDLSKEQAKYIRQFMRDEIDFAILRDSVGCELAVKAAKAKAAVTKQPLPF